MNFRSYETARDAIRELQATLTGAWNHAAANDGDLSQAPGLTGDNHDERYQHLMKLEKQANDWLDELQNHWVPRRATQQRMAEEAIREGALVPATADVDPIHKRGPEGDFARLASLDWAGFRFGTGAKPRMLDAFDLLGARREAATTVQPVGGTFESGLMTVGGQPLQPPNVLGAIPKMPVSTGNVAWIEITTQTNAAAGRAVGAPAPESTLTPTKHNETIVNTAHILPVADEVYEDNVWANSYIPTQFTRMVENAVDRDILNGDGSANKLTGLDSITGGITDATARADATTPAAQYIGEQAGVVEGTNLDGGSPNVVIMRPQEWWKMRVSNENGRWPFGDPGLGVGRTLLGMQVLTNGHLAEGVGYIATFDAFNIALALRQGAMVEASQDAEFKEFNTVLRGQVRAFLVPFRRSSFIKVGGLQH